jgi:hypothetical protein
LFGGSRAERVGRFDRRARSPARMRACRRHRPREAFTSRGGGHGSTTVRPPTWSCRQRDRDATSRSTEGCCQRALVSETKRC